MKKVISFFVSKLKKTEYVLDPKISDRDLLELIIEKLIYFIRGCLYKVTLRNCGKVIFVGKKVVLKYKRYMKIGNGVTIGDYVEIDALSQNGVEIGNNVRVGNYSIIRCTGSYKNLGKGFSIGNNSGIGDYCFFGAAGGVKIGENVIMGQNVRFHSENHNFDRIDIPIKQQGVTNKGIVIDDDCWIGAGATFLDGVKVGKGCVIGANTLVNKDIPPFSVAVGMPVKIIKQRG